MDILLSIVIHIMFRDTVSSSGLNLRYVAIVFVSLLAMGLISLYLLMAYTVNRRTKAYTEYGILEIRDMKDEKLRFWVVDKVMTGNVFQRHFNLLMMLKDVWVCLNLLALYTNTLAMMCLLLLVQLVFSILASLFPPFTIKWQNTVMQITQWSYVALDFMFILNEILTLTPEQRYFFIGFSMIGCVIVTMVANVGIGTYQNMRATCQKCKKKKEKLSQVKSTPKDSVELGDSKDGIKEANLSNLSASKATTDKEMLIHPEEKNQLNQGVPRKIRSIQKIKKIAESAPKQKITTVQLKNVKRPHKQAPKESERNTETSKK